MDTQYITKKELEAEVHEMLPEATVAQYKWIYCYLKDLEDWPIVTDESKMSKDLMGHGID